MAYQTGTYSNLGDALTQLVTFAVAQGWTNNTPASGQQLYKSIGGVDCYFNFAALGSGTVPTWPGYDSFTNVLLVTGSTGFNVSLGWDFQPGATVDAYTSGDPIGGNVNNLNPTGGTYHFFATGTTLSAAYETVSDQLDWRFLTIGNIGGTAGYITSGGDSGTVTTSADKRSSYLTDAVNCDGGSGFYDGTGWVTRANNTSGGATYAVYGLFAELPNTFDPPTGSLAGPIVRYSPDSFRGNQILAPSQIMCTKNITDEAYVIGEIDGVKFTNMKNVANGGEITYDSDTYMCFRIHNRYQQGAAFLK